MIMSKYKLLSIVTVRDDMASEVFTCIAHPILSL